MDTRFYDVVWNNLGHLVPQNISQIYYQISSLKTSIKINSIYVCTSNACFDLVSKHKTQNLKNTRFKDNESIF